MTDQSVAATTIGPARGSCDGRRGTRRRGVTASSRPAPSSMHSGSRCQGSVRGRGRGHTLATTRRPRDGPATNSSAGLVCRGGVGVTFSDSDVPGNAFPGK